MIRHDSGSWQRDDDPGEPSTDKPRLSVTDLEASILAALFHKMIVVEVGTGLGVSTRAIAATAQKVYTVDIDPWVHDNVWPELPDNVVTFKERDHRMMRVVDGTFVDGDHRTQQAVSDVVDALGRSMLLVVVHDFNYPTVKDGCEQVCDGWLHIQTEHGLGVKWLT